MNEIKQQEENLLKEAANTYLANSNTKLSESELKEFVMLCLEHKLNPLKREIYAVKYGNRFNVITNYYEYLKRADATGLLEYYNIEIENENGKPTGRGTFIGKRKDQSKELVMDFWFREWTSGQSTWLTKPYFMFEKCILANGLRRLFPNELSNMPYVNEELWYWNKENEKEIQTNIQLEEKELKKVLE